MIKSTWQFSMLHDESGIHGTLYSVCGRGADIWLDEDGMTIVPSDEMGVVHEPIKVEACDQLAGLIAWLSGCP